MPVVRHLVLSGAESVFRTINLPPALLAALSLVSCFFAFCAPTAVVGQNVPDLVSRTAFRVCEDPSNLPFSDRTKQGFENKIADIIASELKKPVRYFWAPSGPGFVTNTLNEDLCDVVMGTTIGSEMVQSTNPYYRSTYVIVTPKGSPLADVQSIDDPKLKGHRIGIFEATPPTDAMLTNGLLLKAKLYPLLVDHRFNAPLDAMLGDLKDKGIDAAVVWGPLIGDSVKTTGGALTMTPLLKDVDRAGFSYRIALGGSPRRDRLEAQARRRAAHAQGRHRPRPLRLQRAAHRQSRARYPTTVGKDPSGTDDRAGGLRRACAGRRALQADPQGLSDAGAGADTSIV